MTALRFHLDDAPLPPRAGYNAAAATYDAWPWQKFWRRNESPLVTAFVSDLAARRVLDAGTGTGPYLEWLFSWGCVPIGIDISENMLAQAAGRVGARGHLAQADLLRLPFSDESFDLALCCRVLTHVADLSSAFRELGRVLRHNGRLIVTVVAAEHDYETTRIPVAGGRVAIRTFKWGVGELIKAAEASSLVLRESRDLNAGNVAWLPENGICTSLDRSNPKPVCVCMLFLKR